MDLSPYKKLGLKKLCNASKGSLTSIQELQLPWNLCCRTASEVSSRKTSSNEVVKVLSTSSSGQSEVGFEEPLVFDICVNDFPSAINKLSNNIDSEKICN